MNNDSTLKKKLAAYSAMAGAVTATGNLANAQVIYTDIPDTTLLTGETYPLDLNNDSIVDYVIGVTPNLNSTFDSAEIYASTSLNTNAVAASLGAGGFYYPFLFSNGALINQANNWLPAYPFATLLFIYTTGIIQGNWVNGVSDGYIGLRFKISGETHYGWVRLDVAADAKSAVVKDYAYNSTPDSGIVATPVTLPGVHELAGSMATLTVNENRLEIALPFFINNARLEISNMNGQLMLNKDLRENAESIDLTPLHEGTYVATVYTGKQQQSLKFMRK